MKVIKVPTGGDFNANCYIVFNEENNQGFLIDPGFDGERIDSYVESNNISLNAILLTHGHMDHVGAVDYFINKYKLPVYINEKDDECINKNVMVFGKIQKANFYLEDGQILNIAGIEIKVIETPGHTPGGVCFLCNNILFTGDTVFRGSIGRTDFPGGDYEAIINSIINKIAILDDNIEVYPGHEGSSTIGMEKMLNPYFS